MFGSMPSPGAVVYIAGRMFVKKDGALSLRSGTWGPPRGQVTEGGDMTDANEGCAFVRGWWILVFASAEAIALGCGVAVEDTGLSLAGSQVSAVVSSTGNDDTTADSSSSGASSDSGDGTSGNGVDLPDPMPPDETTETTETTAQDPAGPPESVTVCAAFCEQIAGCGIDNTGPGPGQNCDQWCVEPWDEGPCDAAWIGLVACVSGLDCVAVEAFVVDFRIPAQCSAELEAYWVGCQP